MLRVEGRPFAIRPMPGFGLFRPRHAIPGGEIAGRIEADGKEAKSLEPGDVVYGDTCRYGYRAFAEYVRVPAPGGAYVMIGGSWKMIFESAARGRRVLTAAGKVVIAMEEDV
jgi:NADPH:quinone reductase-like Zn-dependent oxidoreductase